MRQLRAMRIGWVLLILNGGLAALAVPHAALALVGTAILAFALTIRFIAARSQSRLRSGHGEGVASSDTTQGTWLTDAIGWTALSTAHHHNAASADAHADDNRRPQADSSESSGGFFSFFSDSGSSDSGGSSGDSGGSDYSSSDAGSSDSGSSSGGSWD
jgi:hypothetical protein